MAEAIPTTKTCRVCNTEKGRELFPKQGRVCKACISKRTLTRYTPEQQATHRQQHPEGKTCSRCGEVKGWEEFFPVCTGRGGVTPHCRACWPEIKGRLRAKSSGGVYRRKVEIEATTRARAAIEAAVRAWRTWLRRAPSWWMQARYEALGKPWANPRLTKAEAYRVRITADPAFAVMERVRQRMKKLRRHGRLSWVMRSALARGGDSPTLTKLLGYSAARLRHHLERGFTRGMTWDRFLAGDIHIDHIVPTTEFDLTTEDGVRACWALSNLRPCWAAENIRKSDQRLTLL